MDQQARLLDNNDLEARIRQLPPAKRALLEQRLRQQQSGAKPFDGISKRQHDGSVPLSFSQERLWFLTLLTPDSPAHNRSVALSIEGRLQVDSLHHSLQAIVQRHAILRTAFPSPAGKPSQVVLPQLLLPLPLVDLTDLSGESQQAALQQLVLKETRQFFDLSQSPLLKARLFKLCTDEHLLVLTMHHILFDGWSTSILLHDLTAYYAACCTNCPPALPELPVQYTDFACWEREHLQGDRLARLLDYWKQHLAGPLPRIHLPADYPRTLSVSWCGAIESLRLPAHLKVALEGVSSTQNATLFMTLLAAFKILLYRYTGQDDIVVGTPVANRRQGELQHLIGFFVNTLVLRTRLSAGLSFQEVLEQVRQTALAAYDHQELPFEVLVRELQPERQLDQPPLFQVLFNFENVPRKTYAVQGVEMREWGFDPQIATHELAVEIVEEVDALICRFQYRTDLFRAETITRLLRHYQMLLEGIVAHPDQPIARLPLLTAAERHQILVEWNATSAPYPTTVCLHHLIATQVLQTPDAPALIYEDQTLTYQELDQRANQLAYHLQSLGIGPDIPVALCAERSFAMVIALLGILKAGGAYVPLDPSYPRERLSFILSDSHAPVLLTQQHLQPVLPPHTAIVRYLDSDWEQIARSPTTPPNSEVTAAHLAYIIYTSGSTGQPKGVLIDHRAIVNRLLWMQDTYHLTPADRILQKTPFSFDVSVWEFFWPLLTGACLVIARPEGHKDSAYLVTLIQQAQITTLHFVPSMLQVFLEEAGVPHCAALRRIICSGEALPYDLQERCFARLPHVALHNLYGPTEAAVEVSSWACERESPRQIVPIGVPVANTQLYVLDAHVQPVPIGVPGELHIGGVQLSRGYLNRPALTAEKFILNPFSTTPGARLYKTGDLARFLPDGAIEYLGRLDHQVKLRGFRIELGEIEAVLAQHPAVREAVVLAREDTPGQKYLAAYIVPRGESTVAGRADSSALVQELRAFLPMKLPAYMLPASFVVLEALPLMSNGKVNRRALPAPTAIHTRSGTTYVAPRTPSEEVLVGMWTSLLHVPQVGIHDNFFDLGGHSLLATQLVSRLRQTFHVELPLRTVFEAPTVATLALHIEMAQRAGTVLLPPITPATRDGELPLSFAQQRLWFLAQLEPDSPFYNVPMVLRFQGRLDVAALEHSLSHLVQRHEVLRTTFVIIDGQPVQVIVPPAPLPLPIVDLRHLPPAEREAAAQRLARAEAQQLFELHRGPLLRVHLFLLAPDDYLALFTMHHIITDGWSIDVLLREIAALYSAAQAGEAAPLPALPIQYADFAVWQRAWLRGAVLEQHLTYWQQQLQGIPPLLELPTDRPRPTAQTSKGATYRLSLPTALAEAVRHLSQQSGCTLFMTLLAAFQVLLARYSGQTDICVGTPIANRTRAELEPLIGFFANTLVLRGDLSGNPTFRTLLQQVRAVTLDAYRHQDVPFEMVVEALQPERNLSQTPLFQVMFVLQNAPMEALELPGVQVQPLEIERESAKFDLTLSLQETPTGLRGHVEYATALFDAATIERMVSHFQTLLEGIVANPDHPITTLPLLTAAERQHLLHEWNAIARAYPHAQTIHALLTAQVERTPDALAVVAGEQQLSYRDLELRANQLAHYLRRHGVGRGVRVGLLLARSLEMIVATLAVLKSGGVYVPIDPEWPQVRVNTIIADTGMPVVLTQTPWDTRLSGTGVTVIPLDVLQAEIACAPGDPLPSPVTADDLSYIMYTSGSTGRPKGVCIPHRGVVRLVQSTNYATFTAQDVFLHLSSPTFDAATFELWGSLLNGARLVVFPPHPPVLSDLGRVIRTHGVTILFLPTGLFNLIVDEDVAVLQGVRQVLTGGEVMSVAHMVRAYHALPGCRLSNVYGPTENTTFTTSYLLTSPPSQRVPIGRPIANTQVYILDARMQPVPIGVPGELYLGGDGLAWGYLNQTGLTAATFLPHPFSRDQAVRLYRTGDQARYLPDGNIEFLGRCDRQVKIRGFRVEPGEVEAILLQCPGVKTAVVTVQADSSGVNYLIAYVVGTAPRRLTAEYLRDFMRHRVPDFLLPTVFIPLDALPLTAQGKIDRVALPIPQWSLVHQKTAPVQARTVIEEKLVLIWWQLLEANAPSDIGIFDDFFQIGGHSLLAIQMMHWIEREFGKAIPLAEMFRSPTIAHLAEILHQAGSSDCEGVLVPLRPEGMYPPLFCLHTISGHVIPYRTLVKHLAAGWPIYGLRARGLNRHEKPHVSIEAMAADYINEICRLQPRGPYFLCGYCFGGKVAFEVARQLQTRGEEVALLALIDSSPDISRLFGKLTRFASRILPVSFQQRVNPIWQGLQDRWYKAVDNIHNHLAMLENVFAYGNRVTSVKASCYLANDTYTPGLYYGGLELFVSQHDRESAERSRRAWQPFVAGTIDVYHVSGTHFTLLHEKSAHLLAEQLNACLRKAQAGLEQKKSDR